MVPTYKNHTELARTLSSIVHTMYRGPVEVVVVADGHDGVAEMTVATAAWWASNKGSALDYELDKHGLVNRDTTFVYGETAKHFDNGNFARNEGIKKATGEWIIFLDAGCGMLFTALEQIDLAIKNAERDSGKSPDIVVWDVLVTRGAIILSHLSTWIHGSHGGFQGVGTPSIGASIKTERAKKMTWPDAPNSDAIYWTRVALEHFGSGSGTAAVINYPLTVAYCNKDNPDIKGGPFGTDYPNFLKEAMDGRLARTG